MTADNNGWIKVDVPYTYHLVGVSIETEESNWFSLSKEDLTRPMFATEVEKGVSALALFDHHTESHPDIVTQGAGVLLSDKIEPVSMQINIDPVGSVTITDKGKTMPLKTIVLQVEFRKMQH